MTTTFTLPDGYKVRCASKRRYVVVTQHVPTFNNPEQRGFKPQIRLRTDNLDKARRFRNGEWSTTRVFILDQQTKEIIK